MGSKNHKSKVFSNEVFKNTVCTPAGTYTEIDLNKIISSASKRLKNHVHLV